MFNHLPPRPQRGWKFISSDLTSATDLFPHDLVLSLIEGIIEGSGSDFVDSVALRLAGGPQRVSWLWPEIKDAKGVVKYPKQLMSEDSKRGILMGLPTSFTLMCMIHEWWVREAVKSSAVHGWERRTCMSTCKILGDDLIAYWPAEVISAYEDLGTSIGAKFSPGKHYHSSDGFVFAERSFLAPWDYSRASAAGPVRRRPRRFTRVDLTPVW